MVPTGINTPAGAGGTPVTASCVTVIVCCATTSVPVLAAPVFAATVKATVPLVDEPSGGLMVIHGVVVHDVHGVPGYANDAATLSELPSAATCTAVGLTEAPPTTRMSLFPFASGTTRLDASDGNVRNRPSALRTGAELP